MDEFTSVLTIARLGPEHAGTYTCKAENVAGSDSHSQRLSVHGTQFMISFSSPGFQRHLLLGFSLFYCVVMQPLSVRVD